jgi:ferrochelatase
VHVSDVILLTYGEPPRAELRSQFEYSRRILDGLTRLVAPIPRWLVPALAARRALLRTVTWRTERYGSPIEALTREQAQGLSEALAARAPHRAWRVHVAYEFRDPSLEDMLARMGEGALVVPMYLAESEFTHDLARRKLAARNGDGRGARVLPALGADALARLSADWIESELARRGIAGGPDWALVLAAHGTLVDPPRPMNTGREATEAVALRIADRLAGRFGAITPAWLNHAMGGTWTSPAADVALRELADRGFRRIVYFPYGFVADNAESQLEGRVLLRAERRFEEVVHLPCLNAAPAYMGALADAIAAALDA